MNKWILQYYQQQENRQHHIYYQSTLPTLSLFVPLSFSSLGRTAPLLSSNDNAITRVIATSTNDNTIERDEFDEDWEEYDPKNGPFIHHMIAGSWAGFVEHSGMYPVDWAKTHLQANRHASNTDMQRFFQKQSLRSMYRGVGAVFAGVVPAHSAYYSIYEIAKDKLGANRRGHHPLAAGASGAVATVAHDLVMTPLDVVKQRMQLGMYKGVWHAVRVIIKTEGLSSLLL
jgi:hypothetical protein